MYDYQSARATLIKNKYIRALSYALLPFAFCILMMPVSRWDGIFLGLATYFCLFVVAPLILCFGTVATLVVRGEPAKQQSMGRIGFVALSLLCCGVIFVLVLIERFA